MPFDLFSGDSLKIRQAGVGGDDVWLLGDLGEGNGAEPSHMHLHLASSIIAAEPEFKTSPGSGRVEELFTGTYSFPCRLQAVISSGL